MPIHATITIRTPDGRAASAVEAVRAACARMPGFRFEEDRSRDYSARAGRPACQVLAETGSDADRAALCLDGDPELAPDGRERLRLANIIPLRVSELLPRTYNQLAASFAAALGAATEGTGLEVTCIPVEPDSLGWQQVHRGRATPFDLLLAEAALLVLKWAQMQDEDEAAQAAFDRTSYIAVFADDMRLDVLAELPPERLVRELRANVLPRLLDRGRLGPVGAAAACAAGVLERGALGEDALLELVREVAAQALASASGRTAGQAAFDRRLGESVRLDQRGIGPHSTPAPVAELMAELLQAEPGQTVYDPCFGLGGGLTAVAERMEGRARTTSLDAWRHVRTEAIHGVEISPEAYVVGLARLILAGVARPNLELGDALRRPTREPRFDRAVANPPWGMPLPNDGFARAGAVPETRTSEARFLVHTVQMLKAGGRAVVAVPDALLHRQSDTALRAWLLQRFRVEGVVSLPEDAFGAMSRVSASLLVISRATPTEGVRFLEAAPPMGKRLPPAPGADGEAVRDWARETARLFREGTSSGSLWETPVGGLQVRGWELLAKRSGEEALHAVLAGLGAEAIRPLGDLAETITTGIAPTPAAQLAAAADGAVLFVGAGDIQRGKLSKPSRYLRSEYAARASVRASLAGVHLLVQRTGTSCKSALVGDTGAKALYSSGLFGVRLREGMLPAYLHVLLQAPEYQQWLKGHARGSGVRSITIATLRGMPVPLVSLPLQERLVRQSGDGQGSPLALLRGLLSGPENDPLLSWWAEVDGPLVEAFALSQDPMRALPLGARVLGSLCFRLTGIAGKHPMSGWWTRLLKATDLLCGCDTVPPGLARYHVLGEALQHLRQALDAIAPRDRDTYRNAAGTTDWLLRTALAAQNALLEDVRWEVACDPDTVQAGRPAEVVIRLTNRSALPLRSVSIRSDWLPKGVSRPFVDVEETVPLAVTVPAQVGLAEVSVACTLDASRLDGGHVGQRLTAALPIRHDQDRSADLGACPYVVGDPIDRDEMLFGREGLIADIRRLLPGRGHGHPNVVLLEGVRRSGKSSILRHFTRSGLPGWVVVECSFQGADTDASGAIPTAKVFQMLTRRIGLRLIEHGKRPWFCNVDLPSPDRDIGKEFVRNLARAFRDEDPFQVFEAFVKDALRLIAPQRLLLMLDEFDKLQEGIEKGVTSPTVPENLRCLIQSNDDLSDIITGARRMARLRQEYWSALYGLGQRMGVSALHPTDARRLVTDPVAERLRFLDEARDRVCELCACQPFLIQALCSRVFAEAAHTGERVVTLGMVEAAVAEMVADNEHFRTLWGYAATERRRLIMALCQRHTDGPDPVTLPFLESRLDDCGVRMPPRAGLGEDMQALVDLELLALQQDCYRLAIPLMAAWIDRHIDFSDCVRRAQAEDEAQR